MRLGYLVPRLVVVGCLWAFFAFAFDPLLRWSVVTAGQSTTGAKVDVAALDTTFFPPTLSVREVAVADPSSPMQNLVEFDELKVSLWGRPLLKRKLVVEEASVAGVEFGTPRTESGALPETVAGPGVDLGLDQYFDAIKGQATNLGNQWLDDLVDRVKMELDPNQLASVRLAATLEADWRQRLDGLQTRVEEIETRIETLRNSVDVPGRDPIERIRAYQQAAVEARSLLDEAKRIRAELNQLGLKARSDFAQVEVARQQDLETIRSKADVLKMDGGEITQAVLGPTITGHLETAGEWMGLARRYAGAVSTPKPQRLDGRVFEFPRPEDDLPNLLVKKLGVSGRFAYDGIDVPFHGVVTDLTSEPRRLDRPTLVRIVSDGEAEVRIDAVVDQRPDVPVQDVTITFALPRPTESRLGSTGDKLQLGVTAARTDCKARFRIAGKQVDGRVAFEQSPVTIVSQAGEGVEEQVARVLASSLGGVQTLQCNVAIGGTFDAPEWSIESNLGPQLASGLEGYLASELEGRKTELIAEANALVDERVAALKAKLDGRFRDVVAQLDLDELNTRKLMQQLAGGRLDRLDGILPAGGNAPVPTPGGDDVRRKLDEKLRKELEEKNPFDLLRRR